MPSPFQSTQMGPCSGLLSREIDVFELVVIELALDDVLIGIGVAFGPWES